MRAVPFTIKADLDMGMRVQPYCVENGQDVTFRAGIVPEKLSDTVMAGTAFEVSADQFLLKIPGGIRFLVSGGDSIIYERGGKSDREVALFLLGSAWGALCYQRSLLPFHASAIVRGDAVHAFTGPSGAGKSTLSAALADQGHEFFTDDVLIIDPAEIGTSTRCYAGQKDLKLWNDSLKLTDATKMSPVRDAENFEKFFAIPAHTSEKTSGNLASLSILRNWHSKDGKGGLSIEKISGAVALRELRDSVYRPRFASAIWGREKLFQILAKLIAGVHVQSFQRPMQRDHFGESLAYMDQWIKDWKQQEEMHVSGDN